MKGSQADQTKPETITKEKEKEEVVKTKIRPNMDVERRNACQERVTIWSKGFYCGTPARPQRDFLDSIKTTR